MLRFHWFPPTTRLLLNTEKSCCSRSDFKLSNELPFIGAVIWTTRKVNLNIVSLHIILFKKLQFIYDHHKSPARVTANAAELVIAAMENAIAIPIAVELVLGPFPTGTK